MINFFIAQSTSVQLFMLTAHALVVLLLAISCMRWLGSRFQGRKDFVPVAPFFTAVTMLYALFLAFHASTIWSRQHAAEVDFRDEVTAISRLASLFGKEGLGLENARLHLSRYVDSVVREEWVTGNTKPSPKANQTLEELRQELIRASERIPTALGNHLWRVFDDIMSARSEHLWIAAHGRSDQSWVLVLVLGLLSHIAIGLVHADRPLAGMLAMALFACATTAAYWLLTRAINPFANLDTMQYLQAISGG